jgi:acyl-CoA synthetase (AMP-forming)/AMP-acid ligase II
MQSQGRVKVLQTISEVRAGKTPQRDATLLDVLDQRAKRAPDALAYCHLVDGESDTVRWTYAQLANRVEAVACLVRQRVAPGAPVLLVLEPGLLYVAALFGILKAGAIAVPSFPPAGTRALSRLAGICADCHAQLVIADDRHARSSSRLQQALAPEVPSWLFLNEAALQEAPAQAQAAAALPTTIALLQYTSGSTGQPKGVVLTHANLVSNSAVLAGCLARGPQPVVGCSWLPPYHDMGLMGALLLALFAGFPLYMMSPAHFVQRPSRWLKAVSDYRVTTSVGPNFALDLCVDHIPAEEVEALDLSSLSMLFCGAEPVRRATLDRFAAKFGRCGFDPKAYVPCYGLAEATLFISGRVDLQSSPQTLFVDAEALGNGCAVPSTRHGKGLGLVSCGSVAPGHRLRIVDSERCVALPDGSVGEIWFAGDSVAEGYYGQPALTAATFDARLVDDTDQGRYLRTGDLGFVHGGELYITGRIKDLIIVAGRNLYPQDLEVAAVDSHPAIRQNAVVAFSHDDGGHERVAIVAEVARSARLCREGLEQAVQAIRGAIATSHSVSLHSVHLVPFGSIPLTTSGKVQRRRTRELFLDGALVPIMPVEVRRLDTAEAP